MSIATPRLVPARFVLGVAVLISCGGGNGHPAVPEDGPGGDGGDGRDGGDGGDGGGSDVTPPAVIAVTPASGDVWLHAPIRVQFDEPIDAAAATVAARVAGDPVDATLEVDGDTLVVAIDPAARGVGALELHVAGATDRAGNAATPFDVQLTLPPWSHPDLDLDRGVAMDSPALAVTDDGAVVAAWSVGAIGARQLVVSRHERGAWQALGDPLGAADPSSPTIAVDASGRPVVAWIEAGQARASRWEGASWVTLASPGAGSQVRLATPSSGGDPTVAVFGAAVVVSTLATAAWTPLATLPMPGSLVGEPALAVPVAGRATVGFIASASGLHRLHVVRWESSWSAIAPITLAASSDTPHLSLAAVGTTTAVAWDDRAGSVAVLAAIAADAATSWTRLGHALDVDVTGDATAPAIALDREGAPIVAWHERIEGTSRGVLARWSGAAWTIVGGHSWLTAPGAPTRPWLALHAGQAPVVGWSANGAIGVAQFNGPRVAGVGLVTRQPLTGCAVSATNPPARLLQTGCFTLASAGIPIPHAGLVPYDVVSELWTDGAKKRRWIALPPGMAMTATANGAWDAPAGTFVLKEFALETTPGNPATRRAIETRFLVRDTSGWLAFTYRWRADGTDADLLADTNDLQTSSLWPMDDGSTHEHLYPSRTACERCHGTGYGPLLGLRAEQLTRWFDYGGVIADQLPTLAHLAVGPATAATPFVSAHDPSETPERRMRGYMAANCAHCHNPSQVAIKDMRYTTPLAQTRLCEVIVPGSPADSIVYQRVSSRPGMPVLGSAYVDPLAVSVLGSWITGMTACP